MTVPFFAFLGMASLLVASSQPVALPPKTIEGFGPFRFGMDFEPVISLAKASTLNSYAISECRRDLPLTGCLVGPSYEADAPYIRDAIPYLYTFSFNKFAKLTDVSVAFRREGGITGNQCIDIFSRTLDWATDDYGPLLRRKINTSLLAQETTLAIPMTSRRGNSYWKYPTDKKGNFLFEFLFSDAGNWKMRLEDGNESLYSPTRHVSLFGSYINVDGKPYCNISLDFSEADTVERREMNLPSLE